MRREERRGEKSREAAEEGRGEDAKIRRVGDSICIQTYTHNFLAW